MKKLLLLSLVSTFLLAGCYIEGQGYYEASSSSYANLRTATAADFYRRDPIYVVVDTPPPAYRVQYVPVAPSAVVIWIPGCWNWTGTTYIWSTGYYAPDRTGYFWRVPRYLDGRYYRGRWIRGTAPRWHYSRRVRPGTTYVPEWSPNYRGPHATGEARAYTSHYRRPAIHRAPRATSRAVPPWSPDYSETRDRHPVYRPAPAPRRQDIARPRTSRDREMTRPVPTDRPSRPLPTAPAAPVRPRSRAI